MTSAKAQVTLEERAKHDANVYIAKHMPGTIEIVDVNVYLVTQRGYSFAMAQRATQMVVDALGTDEWVKHTFSPSVIAVTTYDDGGKRTLGRILRWQAVHSSRGYVNRMTYMPRQQERAPQPQGEEQP